MKHCLNLLDVGREELRRLVSLALEIKQTPAKFAHHLEGRWLLMLFQKGSTRTRISFEIGMGRLGGRSVVMDWDSSNFAISPIAYEARYVSSCCDLVIARLKRHADLCTLAEHSTVPVVNGCDEKFHPCQALADLVTIQEHAGELEGQRVVFVGVHNNVANSLALALSTVGAHLTLVTAEEHAAAIVPEVMSQAKASGLIEHSDNLREACLNANFVYTDTWVDMELFNDPNFAAEKERRLRRMQPFQLSPAALEGCHARIMHDMPIHPGYEIDETLVEDPRSIIFQQAYNRMPAQQALMLHLLGVA